MTTLTTLVGNPQPSSRTLAVAEELASQVSSLTGAERDDTIDLANVAKIIFDYPSDEIDALIARVARPGILVVATPTYKASYTGLLKSFLDRYGANGLAGVTAIPVFTIGSPAHALAVEHTLRPLLVELGASVPTRGLAFPTSNFDDRASIISEWLEGQKAALV
ncbi:FMN reductase [Microbacterium sorbitolivorans]|uniref:NADPH-dependent oxidoreductase n=1 Tax=Microbacterium sorbitolivorans TaxID=1867410 RepID=A0A367XU79_9MICO|nr:NAD(P)H-dependent oxidoreductase [Microbacterium sorbitolivorans]RCK57144.1 NADPH-dependent oxidoreductase [Microbacterium sorbitolivorans]GGF46305.1 FMN reductase [Microbacterium sorbitolivorans]